MAATDSLDGFLKDSLFVDSGGGWHRRWYMGVHIAPTGPAVGDAPLDHVLLSLLLRHHERREPIVLFARETRLYFLLFLIFLTVPLFHLFPLSHAVGAPLGEAGLERDIQLAHVVVLPPRRELEPQPHRHLREAQTFSLIFISKANPNARRARAKRRVALYVGESVFF